MNKSFKYKTEDQKIYLSIYTNKTKIDRSNQISKMYQGKILKHDPVNPGPDLGPGPELDNNCQQTITYLENTIFLPSLKFVDHTNN